MSVTVVIPVHGRSALTRRCLDAVFAADLPVGTRILVVDDASPDDTAAVLADHRSTGAVDVLTHRRQTGFAEACNDGIAAAGTDWVCLLNNDTEPHPGWLHALLADAAAHPGTAAVGARLLYPNGTVQHAGVVIGRDRQPHHAYVGFPGDHPAVRRSRDMQVVTAACVLLDRQAFVAVGGFDGGYRNGHEDVDLCLRLRAAGYRVRYCGAAAVTHLESATRGRRTREAAANGRRYLDRWADAVRPDDLETYAEDGLLELRYDGDATPLRLAVDPLLATGGGAANARLEELLRIRALQVAELLADNVALTLAVGRPDARIPLPRRSLDTAAPDAQLAADDAVQVALLALHRALADRLPGLVPSTGAEYRAAVRAFRPEVTRQLSPRAVVAVVSRGDDALLELPVAGVEHFPADGTGRWAGAHPADDGEAIELLAAARSRGVTHFVLPAWDAWWLEFYAGLAVELGPPAGDPAVAYVFDLATALTVSAAPAATGADR